VTSDNFMKSFSQQYKLAKQARTASGAPFNPVTFVSNYASKNHWNINPGVLAKAVGPIANDPAKLAQYVYSIAMDQSGVANTAAPASGGTSQQGAASALTSAAIQIGKTISKMRGKENYDDLEYVAKSAMQALYKQNPQAYNDLYKEIMSGQTKKQVPSTAGSHAFGQMTSNLGVRPNTMANAPVSATSSNPNIVRCTNESKRS